MVHQSLTVSFKFVCFVAHFFMNFYPELFYFLVIFLVHVFILPCDLCYLQLVYFQDFPTYIAKSHTLAGQLLLRLAQPSPASLSHCQYIGMGATHTVVNDCAHGKIPIALCRNQNAYGYMLGNFVCLCKCWRFCSEYYWFFTDTYGNHQCRQHGARSKMFGFPSTFIWFYIAVIEQGAGRKASSDYKEFQLWLLIIFNKSGFSCNCPL